MKSMKTKTILTALVASMVLSPVAVVKANKYEYSEAAGNPIATKKYATHHNSAINSAKAIGEFCLGLFGIGVLGIGIIGVNTFNAHPKLYFGILATGLAAYAGIQTWQEHKLYQQWNNMLRGDRAKADVIQELKNLHKLANLVQSNEEVSSQIQLRNQLTAQDRS